MDNLINYSYITEYLRNIIPDGEGIFSGLEKYAEENHIPIIFKEVKQFFKVIIPMIKPGKVLEIGTAIGYSALLFASLSEKAYITTVEIDEKMFEEAALNIAKSEHKDRISLINEDAANILPYLKTEYDLIFIDAAKGQYYDYYIRSKKLLKKGGYIIFDNVLYKGLPANEALVTHKHRTIANNLDRFNRAILKDSEMTASLIPIGDGLLIARKDK